MVLPSIVIRQTEVATILDVDAPRVCRAHRSLIHGPRSRSDAPSIPALYCGIVLTDKGSFDLPQSRRFQVFGATREALFDQLQEGCVARFTVAGTGTPLSDGAGLTNRNRTLVRIEPVEGCA